MWLLGLLCSPVQEKGLWGPQPSRKRWIVVTSHKVRSLESREYQPYTLHDLGNPGFPEACQASWWECICFAFFFFAWLVGVLFMIVLRANIHLWSTLLLANWLFPRWLHFSRESQTCLGHCPLSCKRFPCKSPGKRGDLDIKPCFL